MKLLNKLILEREEWIIKRVFEYAQKHDYLRYISNPEEEFHVTIKALIEVINITLEKYDKQHELNSNDDYSQDLLSSFGIREAKKQKTNEINLEISFGLLKYYRQSFIDILFISELENDKIENYRLFLNRCFDRVEIGFGSEWNLLFQDEKLLKMQNTARFLTQEKNKHIALLESISDPIILVDKLNTISYSNAAAMILFKEKILPVKYNSGNEVLKISDWLLDLVKVFREGNDPETSVQKKIVFLDNIKQYLIKIKKIQGSTGANDETYIILNDITQIKQAENYLQKYEYIVEQCPVSIIITDKNGDIEYVNPKFSSITGYSFDEVIHKNPRILKSGEKSSEEYKELWDSLINGKGWNGMFHNKRKNGELFWELASISPLRDENGEIINFIGVKEDITEQKKAEETMIESEMQFRSVWENSFNGMRLTDENGIIVRVNESFCKMVEMTKDLLEGMPISLTYFTENRARVIKRYKENFAHNSIQSNLEREMLLWNGKTKWLQVTNSIIKLKNDKKMVLSVFKDITENKLAEQFIRNSQDKLRESEKKYQQLVESSQEGILIIDENDMILYVNPSLSKMLNYNQEDVIGKKIFEFVYEEDLKLVKEKNIRRKNRISEQYEIRLVKNGGIIIITMISASPILDEKNIYNGTLAIISDITGKKYIENTLKFERHLFLALMDNIPDFIYYKDVESKFTRINMAMAKYLKLRHPKEAIGKTDFDFYTKEVANSLLKDEKKIISSGIGLYNYDEMTISKNGNVTWFVATKIPLKDQTGKIVGVFGISRDITDRKLMEKILWNEKEELNVTLRSVGEGVITTNKDEKIILLNKKAEEITGYTQEQALNKELTEVFLMIEIKTGQAYLNPIKNILRNRNMDGFEGQAILINSNKNERVVSYNASAIKDRENKYIGFVIVFRDITEQVRLESQRMLSQKMESIGQLAAGISHEINTPMQYIGDNTHFLKDSFKDIYQIIDTAELLLNSDNDNKDTQKGIMQLREIRKNIDLEYLKSEIPNAIEQSLTGIDRVRQIVLAMKDFAHPGIKTKALSDLNHGIEVTVTISRNEWKYVADLNTDLDPSLPFVYCLMDEINQVILNMIVNSSHAIKELYDKDRQKKGNITIKTKKEEDQAVIYITDTGNGIPKEIINKIFDPFFTTKEVGKGTGQGLAIAHDIIVNKHKGSIQVKSELGKGTTFTIKIPILSESNEKG
jgi:two-component system, NtrC family, sensor kinase